jgi:hypothetical protein
MYGHDRHAGLGDGSTDNTDPFYDPASEDPTFGETYLPAVTVTAAAPVLSTISTAFGSDANQPATLVNYGAPSSPTPTGIAYSQAFKNPDGTPTYDGAPYSPTDLLNPYNLRHLFGGFLTPTTPYPQAGLYAPTYAGGATTQASVTTGKMSTATLLLLGALAVGGALLLGKKS